MHPPILYRIRSLDLPVQLVIAALMGGLIGLLFTQVSPFVALGAVIALVLIVVVIKKPSLAVLGIIVFLSTIIPENWVPIIPLGPWNFFITEVIILGLFAVILIRSLVDKTFKLAVTPLDLPLVAFYVWVLLTTVLGVVLRNNDMKYVISEVRIVGYYVVFFVVTNLINKESDLKFTINGFFWLGTGVALAMVIQYLLGPNTPFLPGRVEMLSTGGRVYSDVTRIMDTVGEAIVTVAFITKTIMLFISELRFRKFFDVLQWGLLAAGLVLTFSRTHWLVAGVAILIGAFLVRGQDRQRFLYWGMVLAWVLPIIMTLIYIIPVWDAKRVVLAAIDRAYSINYKDSSLRWRDVEYRYGLPQIVAHPVTGIGLGGIYRPWLKNIDGFGFDGRRFAHNALLWIAMKTGVVGLALFLLVSIIYLSRGFRYWQRVKNPTYKGVVLGFTLSYLSMLVAANVHAIFMSLFWTPVIGLMWGVNEVIYKLSLTEDTQAEPALLET